MEDIKYCVYCHTNRINGKKYIGQTVHQDNPELRWRENGRAYAYNKHFWSAIQKYGWENFDHEIIYKDLTKSDADFLENFLIYNYKTTDTLFGYNNRGGGSRGVMSEKTKQKMSDAQLGHNVDQLTREKLSQAMTLRYANMPVDERGKYILPTETKEKLSNSLKQVVHTKEWNKKVGDAQRGQKRGPSWNSGKHNIFSAETRKRISNANKGRVQSEETKQKRIDTLKELKTMHLGDIEIRVNQNDVQKYLDLGYQFGYKESHIESLKNREYKCHSCAIETKKKIGQANSKSVAQYDGNKLIKVYDSVGQVSKDGFNPSCVAMCCRGERPHHRHFTWKYVNRKEVFDDE